MSNIQETMKRLRLKVMVAANSFAAESADNRKRAISKSSLCGGMAPKGDPFHRGSFLRGCEFALNILEGKK